MARASESNFRLCLSNACSEDLVYSTCTFNPEENEQNIAYFLKKYPDIYLKEIPKRHGIEPGPLTGRMAALILKQQGFGLTGRARTFCGIFHVQRIITGLNPKF